MIDGDGDQTKWLAALSNYSSTREAILAHRFLADVTAELWKRGCFGMAVSHGEVDNGGYDVILEASGIIRHIQLKAMHLGGRARHFPVQRRLWDKPSGCVVLIRHDAVSLAVAGYSWFGGSAGDKPPPIAERIVKHTKPNTLGTKAPRPALIALRLSSFEGRGDAKWLTDHLFGPKGVDRVPS